MRVEKCKCSNETAAGAVVALCEGVFTLYEQHTFLSLAKAQAARVKEEASSLTNKLVSTIDSNQWGIIQYYKNSICFF